MKADFHIHLEEGPYSAGWLKRTFESIATFTDCEWKPHSIEWMQEVFRQLENRIHKGAYTSEWLDLYLKQAQNAGLKKVGIVDHLYRFTEYKTYYEKYIDLSDTPLGTLQRKWLDQVCVASVDSFVTCIQNEKEKWLRNGIELYLGIEADYFPGCESELDLILSSQPYDYVIGSVHFIDGWGFDNPATESRFELFDLETLYDRFFKVVGQAIRSELFDIVAHLDNLKAFRYRPDEQRLLPIYKQIAELLVEHNIATEINAGMVYRYPIKEMCPSPAFLNILSAKGVSIMTSTDAHYPENLGSYTNQQLNMLKEVGFKETVTFKARQRNRHILV
ncbi:histidinol phosphate phosphatase domain-containing protein [Cohnella abietis]|uniref:Histidinol-phosphatase n=1 Tax=Cohnella abietis TaxID=2507935 RepID=A0A3T1CYE5_9BACL|nr:histidinol phosphate phosphatase domain-containing protein [Cohnella abietis]BBI30848.1 histidinol-phosphatase [Cohnella abietis]